MAQPLWVAQQGSKKVSQNESKQVAQIIPKTVAQDKSKQVAQNRLKVLPRLKDSAELVVDKYVGELKTKISNIDGVESRKKFIKEIGWGVMTEKRKRKYYLFGAKKISGRKYKLYIGNATN